MIFKFLYYLRIYFFEITPALLIGFLLSGIVHEFVSTEWVEKNLGKKGLKPIFYSTLLGTIVPVCCWGSLPLAITFYLKGASLGPIFALLISTPATSINAIIVVIKFFGVKFGLYTFFSVIMIGILAGIIGNSINFKVKISKIICHSCDEKGDLNFKKRKKIERIKSVLKFAYIELPRDIGLETLIGLVLASLINSLNPVGFLIRNYLYGAYGYLFSNIVGLIMYMCATMSVPMVYALVSQGLDIGAGLTLLLIGPITSYGTILVLRKEFGLKILIIYLLIICSTATFLGYLYSNFIQ